MAKKHSALSIEAIKPTASRQEEPIGSGLFLVVQPSGAKSWAYRGRLAGAFKKIKLGDYPAVSLMRAKALAGSARAAAHAGRVFAAPSSQAAPEAAPGCSVIDIWAQYRKLRLEPDCREATIAEHSRIFEAHIAPRLGARDIATIVKGDLLPIVDKALDRGPAARNKMTAVLTGFFGWAHEDRDLMPASATVGIKQQTAKRSSKPKRALDDAEIKAFWKACAAIDSTNLSSVRFGAMFQLLLLTGARRNEVAGMRWSEIKGNVWTIPAERVKTGEALAVTFTKTARTVLDGLPRIAGCDYVFGPTGESCGFGFSKAKSRIDAEAEIAAAWRLHDLRRTFRTGLSRLGVREEIAERCINHAPGELIQIYDAHKYEAEMAEAWKVWERHVLKTVRSR